MGESTPMQPRLTQNIWRMERSAGGGVRQGSPGQRRRGIVETHKAEDREKRKGRGHSIVGYIKTLHIISLLLLSEIFYIHNSGV